MEEDYMNFTFNYLANQHGQEFSDNEMARIAEKNGSYPVKNQRIMYQLYLDGFANLDVLENPPGTGLKVSFYSISSKGMSFIHNLPGEYKDRPYSYFLKLIEEERNRKITKEKLEIQQVRSIIDTNKNVSSSLRFQKASSNFTIGLGVLSSVFIAATVYLQLRDPTGLYLEQIKKELQVSRKSMDSIRLSLAGIDSTLKKGKIPPSK